MLDACADAGAGDPGGGSAGEAVVSEARILVVEDEIMVAMLIEDVLGELGHRVVGIARSVGEALAMLERETIDAALLDVNLEGEMVFPVATALRARGLPFAFVTGYGRTMFEQDFADWPLLQKPFRPEDLARLMARLGLGGA